MNAAIPWSKTHLKGALITVDGLDGSGKSTLIEHAAAHVRAAAFPVETIRMPSHECRGLTYIKDYNVNHSLVEQRLADLTSICLVSFGDRLWTMRSFVLPALARGIWVICDRYVFTGLAEMLALCGHSAEIAMLVEVAKTTFAAPDLGIITEVSPAVSMQRVRERSAEKHFQVDVELWGRFAAGYRQVAAQNGLVSINTERDPGGSFAQLRPHLDQLIANKMLADVPPLTGQRH